MLTVDFFNKSLLLEAVSKEKLKGCFQINCYRSSITLGIGK
jgi:hypothetical protein